MPHVIEPFRRDLAVELMEFQLLVDRLIRCRARMLLAFDRAVEAAEALVRPDFDHELP